MASSLFRNGRKGDIFFAFFFAFLLSFLNYISFLVPEVQEPSSFFGIVQYGINCPVEIVSMPLFYLGLSIFFYSTFISQGVFFCVWFFLFFGLIKISRHFLSARWQFFSLAIPVCIVGISGIAIVPPVTPISFRQESFLSGCIGEGAKPSSYSSQLERIEASKRPLQKVENQGFNVNFDAVGSNGDGEFRSYNFDCFQSFVNEKISSENSMINSVLKDSTVADKYVAFCESLPEKKVNPLILHDEALVPGLSYLELCLLALSRNGVVEGNLRIDKTFSATRQESTLNYVCDKVYGVGSSRENVALNTVCKRPYIEDYYTYILSGR